MGVFEAGPDQAEMIEPMVERHVGDGDAEVAHVGEIGQSQPAGLMDLAEDDVPVGTVDRPPGPDAALQGAAHAVAERGMAALDRLEHGDLPQCRCGGEHGNDLFVPDACQGVRPPPPPWLLLLGRHTTVPLKAIADCRAETRPGCGDRRAVGLTELHVEHYLAVGDVSARQWPPQLREKTGPYRTTTTARRGLANPARRRWRHAGRASALLP